MCEFCVVYSSRRERLWESYFAANTKTLVCISSNARSVTKQSRLSTCVAAALLLWSLAQVSNTMKRVTYTVSEFLEMNAQGCMLKVLSGKHFFNSACALASTRATAVGVSCCPCTLTTKHRGSSFSSERNAGSSAWWWRVLLSSSFPHTRHFQVLVFAMNSSP